MVLLSILLVLFVTLAVVVFCLERFGKPIDGASMRRMQRWFFPLILLIMVLQALRYFFG